MKELKRVVTIGLAALTVLSFAACAGSGQGEGGGSKAEETVAPTTIPTVAQDTTVNKLSFTAPEGYATVDRFIEKTSDGKVTEKDITYKFADDSKLVYACMAGLNLSDEIPLDKTTLEEYNGETYNIYESGKSRNAFIQKGEDAYVVSYDFAEKIDKEAFDKLMADVKFSESGEMVDNNNVQLDSIQYTLDSALNVYSTVSNLTQTPAGDTTEKRLVWKFGKDKDNEDFSFTINQYNNTTVEQQKKEDKEYEQKQVGDITYTVRVDGDKKPYEYFVQHGSDVYRIWNGGKSGFVTTRSEECEAAFEKFVNSVSFN